MNALFGVLIILPWLRADRLSACITHYIRVCWSCLSRTANSVGAAAVARCVENWRGGARWTPRSPTIIVAPSSSHDGERKASTMNSTVSSRPSGLARIFASGPQSLQDAVFSGDRHLERGFNNASYLNQQITLHYVTFDCGLRLAASPSTFIRPPPPATV